MRPEQDEFTLLDSLDISQELVLPESIAVGLIPREVVFDRNVHDQIIVEGDYDVSLMPKSLAHGIVIFIAERDSSFSRK